MQQNGKRRTRGRKGALKGISQNKVIRGGVSQRWTRTKAMQWNTRNTMDEPLKTNDDQTDIGRENFF